MADTIARICPGPTTQSLSAVGRQLRQFYSASHDHVGGNRGLGLTKENLALFYFLKIGGRDDFIDLFTAQSAKERSRFD